MGSELGGGVRVHSEEEIQCGGHRCSCRREICHVQRLAVAGPTTQLVFRSGAEHSPEAAAMCISLHFQFVLYPVVASSPCPLWFAEQWWKQFSAL